MTTPDTLRFVEGELNYLVPMADRPRYLAYDAGPDAPPSNMAHEAHTVRIHDMRPISHEIGLDNQGFALVEQRSLQRCAATLQSLAQHILAHGTEAFPHNGVPGSTNTAHDQVNPTVSYDPASGSTYLFWDEILEGGIPAAASVTL